MNKKQKEMIDKIYLMSKNELFYYVQKKLKLKKETVLALIKEGGGQPMYNKSYEMNVWVDDMALRRALSEHIMAEVE